MESRVEKLTPPQLPWNVTLHSDLFVLRSKLGLQPTSFRISPPVKVSSHGTVASHYIPQILFFLECTECLRLPHSSNQTATDTLTLSSSGWFWQWMHGSMNSLTPNFTTALYSAQSAPLGPSLPALGNGLGARAVL